MEILLLVAIIAVGASGLYRRSLQTPSAGADLLYGVIRLLDHR